MLKSGGPKMTVKEAGPSPLGGAAMVWCVWFNGNKTETQAFEVYLVKKVDD
ncbi:DUF2158 domain-containing protein [Azospirillum doebereinerae]